MNGTMPNQAKKHKKNAMEVIQKVRVGRLLKLSRSSLVAFAEIIWNVLIIQAKNSINKYKYVI